MTYSRTLLPLAAVYTTLLVGQSGRPKFEVATMKPTPPAATHNGFHTDPGVIRLEGWSLRQIISAAYSLRPYELVAPAWIDTAFYEVIGKSTKPTDVSELYRMVQPLLEEQCALKWHREKRDLQGFDLLLVTPRKLPAPRPGSCIDMDPKSPPRSSSPGGPMIAACGTILMPGLPGGAGLDGGKVTIAQLASRLNSILGRPIADKTNYSGVFDLHLRFAFEGFGRGPSAAPPEAASDPSELPSIFTAVHELGLKLESAKVPIDVFVVENIQKPTAF